MGYKGKSRRKSWAWRRVRKKQPFPGQPTAVLRMVFWLTCNEDSVKDTGLVLVNGCKRKPRNLKRRLIWRAPSFLQNAFSTTAAIIYHVYKTLYIKGALVLPSSELWGKLLIFFPPRSQKLANILLIYINLHGCSYHHGDLGQQNM